MFYLLWLLLFQLGNGLKYNGIDNIQNTNITERSNINVDGANTHEVIILNPPNNNNVKIRNDNIFTTTSGGSGWWGEPPELLDDGGGGGVFVVVIALLLLFVRLLVLLVWFPVTFPIILCVCEVEIKKMMTMQR